MKLEMTSMASVGDLENERIELRATADTAIGEHAVFCALKAEDGVSSFLRTAYWFPDGLAKAGDTIILYTKDGEDTERPGPNDTTTHVYFWGRTVPVWDNDKFAPVLVRVAEWKIAKPAEQVPMDLSEAGG